MSDNRISTIRMSAGTAARIEADERLSNRQKHIVFTVLDAIVEGAKDG